MRGKSRFDLGRSRGWALVVVAGVACGVLTAGSATASSGRDVSDVGAGQGPRLIDCRTYIKTEDDVSRAYASGREGRMCVSLVARSLESFRDNVFGEYVATDRAAGERLAAAGDEQERARAVVSTFRMFGEAQERSGSRATVAATSAADPIDSYVREISSGYWYEPATGRYTTAIESAIRTETGSHWGITSQTWTLPPLPNLPLGSEPLINEAAVWGADPAQGGLPFDAGIINGGEIRIDFLTKPWTTFDISMFFGTTGDVHRYLLNADYGFASITDTGSFWFGGKFGGTSIGFGNDPWTYFGAHLSTAYGYLSPEWPSGSWDPILDFWGLEFQFNWDE